MENIILIDKPKGVTSFDVCFKLRPIFHTKRIGHTGTLDPNATGLMMILIDKATKANQFLVSAKKEYIATIKLGIKTDSEDIDGKVLETKEEVMPSEKEICEVLQTFIGKSKQRPPLASAIHVKGKRLYEYQKEGIEVEVPLRDIEVYEIELLNIDEDNFTFRCLVSSGTYVRTLGQDILKKLNLIGTLSDLRRTKIDNFDVKDAYKLDDLIKGDYQALKEVDVLSNYYYVHQVDNRNDVLNGKVLKLELNEERILCVDKDDALAIYQKDNGVYRCVRGLL